MADPGAALPVAAVLGGGPAGLAAAWRLARRGHRVVLFEQQEHVGGLGGGIVINGNIYEYGPHLFHTTDREILADIMGIAGDILFPIARPILIKFRGSYFKYPLSIPDVVGKLPFRTLIAAAGSFLIENLRARLHPPAAENSETVLLKNYGRVLYEIFFKNYIEHVWGIPPSGFSPKFASQRIPRLSALAFLFKLAVRWRRRLRPRAAAANFVENVEGPVYSTTRGFSPVAERMADEIRRHGGSIVTGAAVTRLQRLPDKSYRVTLREEYPAAFAAVISTLPLNRLVKMFEPAMPESVSRAADALRFRAITFVGLLVAKPRVLPASIMYFRELSFNRLTDLSYFGFTPAPAGCTLLIAEITCSPGDRFWTDATAASAAVVDELAREGLLDRDLVRETHVYHAEHAYPVFTLGFEQHLERITRAIAGYDGLFVAGRQGLFQYVNIHIAIRTGYDAADAAGKALPAPATAA